MPRFLPTLLLLLALTTAALTPAGRAAELPTAAPESVGMNSQTLAKIGPVVEAAIQAQQTAGAVVVVLRRGKVVHFSAHGAQNLATDSPMARDTIFRIYSMTKPITTAAAMMLWEQGKFQLDDPVEKYLPEFKEARVYVDGTGDAARYEPAARPMTVRDLMRHTSGLTYGGDTPVGLAYQKLRSGERPPLAEYVKQIAAIPLLYQPGTRFEYGVSTDVLGRLVEVWSGESLDEYFTRHIFTPLDMRDTGFHVPAAQHARLAANYGPAPAGSPHKLKMIDDPTTSSYRTSPTLLSGGGGLVSTARDYSRFCQLLLAGGQLDRQRLLKPSTVALMMENHIPAPALPIVQGHARPGWGFGLGFAVRYTVTPDSPTTPKTECRWGGAASTHFWLHPQEELGVVILQQHMPFVRMLEEGVKPIVYEAIKK